MVKWCFLDDMVVFREKAKVELEIEKTSLFWIILKRIVEYSVVVNCENQFFKSLFSWIRYSTRDVNHSFVDFVDHFGQLIYFVLSF